MQKICNFILAILKWPLALFMVYAFLPTLNADIQMVQQTFNSEFFMNFVFPLIGMICLWFFIPGMSGAHLSIFEHELTHMLAAILTFHRPMSMKIEVDRGGSFGYYGRGNWFITLAPYFIPTFPVCIIIFGIIWRHFHGEMPSFLIPVLGLMFGYHLASNFSQIHTEQSDFPKAGWLFSILFLPTANLIVFALVWAFAVKEWAGISGWSAIWIKNLQEFSETFLNNYLAIRS